MALRIVDAVLTVTRGLVMNKPPERLLLNGVIVAHLYGINSRHGPERQSMRPTQGYLKLTIKQPIVAPGATVTCEQ